jgi:hypothetical protein
VVVERIKAAISDGWEERAATDANSREPAAGCRNGSTTRGMLERRSDELGNMCRWASRITNWDAEAVALADDQSCLRRHLKAARQLRTFCETFIAALETRLSN